MKNVNQIILAIIVMLCFSSSLRAGPSSKDYFFIQAKVSKRSLSNSNSLKAKTPIVQRAGPQDSQRWRFISAGGGYYYIISKKSGLYLDVKGGSKASKTIVWQYPRNGSNAQKWKLVKAGKGYYYIQSKISNLYLDVRGGSKSGGATIWQYKLNRTDSQKWKLIKAGKVSKINRAKSAFLYGPSIDEVKLLGHEFNFWKTVKVTKKGSQRVVTGRFSHAIAFARNDKYYFTATFNSKGKMISFKRNIKEGFAIVTPIIKFVANELVGKIPVVGSQIHVTDSDIDYLVSQADKRLGKTSWEKAADEIACILAVAALDK
ncbi:MAG: RICIN domain-containing protein [Saprospiraceae bacterium]